VAPVPLRFQLQSPLQLEVSQATFNVTAIDNQLLDGTRDIQLLAAAAGYENGTAALQVTDAEQLLLTFDVAAISESSGVAVATLRRSNTDTTTPLVVSLTGDAGQVDIPTSVTIPAGNLQTTFSITARDNQLLDGNRTIQIGATASGYEGALTSLQITDFEPLQLTLDVATISEAGGVAIGTVRRPNTDINAPIVVNLSGGAGAVNMPASVTILAGNSQATFNITAIDNALLDGSRSVQISAASVGYENAVASLAITDFEQLQLTLDVATISEQGGVAVGTVRRPNSDVTAPLVINLSGGVGSVNIPATVTIAAGSSEATFNITAIDNQLLDGTREIQISAAAAGYESASAALQITDFEQLQLTLNVATISEFDGVAVGTVRRPNGNLSSPLVVNLSGGGSAANVPATVTIPVGITEATFSITAIDNQLLDGTRSIQISASAAGYAGAATSLQITDFEQLQLTFNLATISERNGVAVGTIRRPNSDIAAPLVVNLSGGGSAVNIPASVTIAAGDSQATFNITAVDNALLDGTRTIQIAAAAAGYVDVSSALQITDAENLQLVFDVGSISEAGGTAIGTVRRMNSDLGLPLVVDLNGGGTQLNLPAQVAIPAGFAQATFNVATIDNQLLDGTRTVQLTASAAGYENAAASIQITDFEQLQLAFDVTSISEQGGIAVATVRRMNTDTTSPLVINLGGGGTQVTVPSTVIIPAGNSQMTFNVAAIDNQLLDGTRSIQLNASAAGYQSAEAALQITDFEQLALTLDITTISENGGIAVATVRRSNTDTASPLVVNLGGGGTQATVPATVTIPAGSAQTTFNVTAIDNQLVDGTRSIQLLASAAGYESAEASLQITDLEQLQLTLDVASISEQGGRTLATVRRLNTDTSLPLVVNLSGGGSQANVPATVTIPAGSAQTTFDVTAIDNQLLDGTRSIQLTASAAGYENAAAALQITDFEQLQLTLGVATISEQGGRTLATVRRLNTNITEALVVNLSGGGSQVTVPATVTIPAGSSQTTFDVTAIDNQLLDGTRSIQLTASATGYENGAAALQITDFEQLQLTFNVTTVSELDGTAMGTVRRPNTDNSLPLVVNLSGGGTQVTFPASVTILAGSSQATFNLAAVDNQLLDGTRSVEIVAMASSYQPASSCVTNH
jgi:hypothetical protein